MAIFRFGGKGKFKVELFLPAPGEGDNLAKDTKNPQPSHKTSTRKNRNHLAIATPHPARRCRDKGMFSAALAHMPGRDQRRVERDLHRGPQRTGPVAIALGD